MRILGLDPTSRGCGYALLEGEGNLIDWGVAGAKDTSNVRILARAAEIIDRSHPDAIAVEDTLDTQRRERAKSLIRGIERLAVRRNIGIVRVTRGDVRERFSPAHKKQEIAEALVRIFPDELGPRLPKARMEWEGETERMNLFDAVSFAVTAQSQ